MTASVLIHEDGAVAWGNKSFLHRFSVNEEALGQVRIKDLLWCLGIPEAIAGMVSEGVAFQRCEIPGGNPIDCSLYLKHICLAGHSGGNKRMMLILSDEFDKEALEICIGKH